MCDRNTYSSIADGDASVEFNTFTEDPVLPDDVDHEQASRSSLESCGGSNNNRYLPNGDSAQLEGRNPYYGKLISMDADSTPYPEDLIMIGSTVDIREDSKPLLLEEEHTLSENYEQTPSNCESVNPTSQCAKTIVVMPEDIEAAGLSLQNLGDLTEAQFTALVDIVERRERSVGSAESSDLIHREQYGTFDGAQLDALRIDINNLTDENIQQIVQLAMPAIRIGNGNFAKSKAEIERRRHEQALVDVINTSQAAGERLQMRQSDRSSSRNPSVRYIKNGKCKVQYEDGRFEWVGDDNLDLCENKVVEHFDHSGYHAGNLPHENENTSRGSVTQIKRQRSTNSFGATASPPKRRSIEQTPNFCCPVCDRKVYQKEPSYIVIRLPACDDCTKERMIVLDERTRRVDDPSK
uniref:Zinc finger protein n=1 Tax=Angiostrongylus cantonensis TaxID=6313 RepID=A0A158P8B6_ANGCA